MMCLDGTRPFEWPWQLELSTLQIKTRWPSSLEDQTTTNNRHNMPSVLSAATVSNKNWDIVQRNYHSYNHHQHPPQLFISPQVFPSRPTKLQSSIIFFDSADIFKRYGLAIFRNTLCIHLYMSPQALKHPLDSLIQPYCVCNFRSKLTFLTLFNEVESLLLLN